MTSRLWGRGGAVILFLLGATVVAPVPEGLADTNRGAAAGFATLADADPLRPKAREEGAITVASRALDGPAASGSAVATKPGRARAAAARPLDNSTLDAMGEVEGDAHWRCLAQAIYFESRGEPLEGQVAVAEVVLNRVDDQRFPDTVCGVTNQGVGSGRGCQFSYACDGRSDAMSSGTARERSEKLAKLMLEGKERTVTSGATYFHTRAVRPGWAGRMTRTTTIGHHHFYRSGRQVAGL